MTSDRSGSWRTCVGCREVERPSVLLRVVTTSSGGIAADGSGALELVPDARRRLPGRGAWIHPDSGCLHQAERRRAFGRALRVPPGTSIDSTPVRRYLTEQVAGTTDAGTDVSATNQESRQTHREHSVKPQR